MLLLTRTFTFNFLNENITQGQPETGNFRKKNLKNLEEGSENCFVNLKKIPELFQIINLFFSHLTEYTAQKRPRKKKITFVSKIFFQTSPAVNWSQPNSF